MCDACNEDFAVETFGETQPVVARQQTTDHKRLYRLTYSYDTHSHKHGGMVRQQATGVFRTYGPICATLMLKALVYDDLGGKHLTVLQSEEVTEADIEDKGA